MAIHWTILLALVVTLAVVQARPPSLYWPGSAGESHRVQTRTHFDESALNGLTENELETLLYLVDKVDRPRVVPSVQDQEHFTYAHSPYYDTRNKRTGAHHLQSKKAMDWSDYFGIDKREVKVNDPEGRKDNDLELSTPASTPTQDAKDDKEREQIMQEFYSNMAMAGNVRRKRNARSHSLDKYMTKAGEVLVTDALKLTGAHRDEKMSKEEFKQLKKELIRRIGAAYDLEKLRQIFEGNLFKVTLPKNNKVGQ